MRSAATALPLVGTGRADRLTLAGPEPGALLGMGGDDTLTAGPGRICSCSARKAGATARWWMRPTMW
jgi:hypothetical protein